MYILGVLSLFQILVLPGLLFLRLFKFKKGILQGLIYSFALSLIFNHLVVVLLTHLRANNPWIHYIIFLIEVGLLIYLNRSEIFKPLDDWLITIQARVKAFSDRIKALFLDRGNSVSDLIKTAVGLGFFIWSIFSILWVVGILIDELGSVFTIWDSVVSWNHWAVEWFSNTHAMDTKRYAQLIPTNFSVTYSYMQSAQIQFFAKGFMPLFGVYFLLAMFDLGLRKNDPGYFIGVVVSQYLLQRFYLEYLSSGYVDVPLIFFTFLVVHALLAGSGQEGREGLHSYVLIGFIFAAGAALTKQNGLLVFAVYPFLAYVILLSQDETSSVREKIYLLGKYFLVAFVLLLPWYVFNEIRIAAGASTNVFKLMSQEHHGGLTRLERLTKAFKDLGIYVYLYPFALAAMPFVKKEIRWIKLTLLFPYALIWAYFFSLYPRNLSISLAVLGFAVGLGASGLLDFFSGLIDRIHFEKLPKVILILLVLAVLLLPAIKITDGALIRAQIEHQKSALNPKLNGQLYAYFEELGGLKPVFSHYPIRFLPGFEDLQVRIGGFDDYDFYSQVIADNPDVEYMLVTLDNNDDRIIDEIQQKIESGEYEEIFRLKIYQFIRMDRE